MNRREFIELLLQGAVALGSGAARSAPGAGNRSLYDLPPFGSARILHMTDCHAQLNPIHFREPNVNIGVGPARGRLPHRVGRNLLTVLGDVSAREAHAFTHLDFSEAAEKFGRVGGFAHLKTLVDRLRDSAGDSGSLLLDGGDSWQGSATALWSRGADMLRAANILGVDLMTGHWEFTYGEESLRENLAAFEGEFLAQNVFATEEAMFRDLPLFDELTGRVFRPYAVRELRGHRVAVIGQAFPYTPIANPARFVPDWTFGIRENELAQLVSRIRDAERVDAVILLSHNGMDVDLKLAERVSGIDFILGGHTHDAMPLPVEVPNRSGKTVVTNAGSHGKFLAVLDLEFGARGVSDYRYRLLPVFAQSLPAHPAMQAHIDAVRAPHREMLEEELAVSDSLLYRRGNFQGSFDQLIVDALREELDAQIALSPGFRWGGTLLPGEVISMERLMDQTAISYPQTTVREVSGRELRDILEAVADNLFNPDPYYQQGGDMVRSGGFSYRLDPTAAVGKRVSQLRTNNGKPVQDSTRYKLASWATVGEEAEGEAVWAVVARYLRARKTLRIDRLETPALRNVQHNPGIEDYAGKLV